MAVFFTNAYDISITALATWTDKDLSAYIPAGGKIAIVRIEQPVTTGTVGVRKNGETGGCASSLGTNYQTVVYGGLDANRICELYTSRADTKFWLLGYFDDTEAGNFTDYTKVNVVNNTWENIDISAQAPAGAVAAVLNIRTNDYTYYWNVRKPGSTDNRLCIQNIYAGGAVIGLDSSRRYQGISRYQNETMFYIVGYLSKGYFETNGIDVGFTTVGVWTDRNFTTEMVGKGNWKGVVLEFISTINAGAHGGSRPDGSANNWIRSHNSYSGHEITGIDVANIAELYLGAYGSSNPKFWIVGWVGESAPPYSPVHLPVVGVG